MYNVYLQEKGTNKIYTMNFWYLDICIAFDKR